MRNDVAHFTVINKPVASPAKRLGVEYTVYKFE